MAKTKAEPKNPIPAKKPQSAGNAAYHAAKRACKAAGLDTTGNAADLKARLAAHQGKSE